MCRDGLWGQLWLSGNWTSNFTVYCVTKSITFLNGVVQSSHLPNCFFFSFLFKASANKIKWLLHLLKKQDSGDWCNLLNCLGPYNFRGNAVVFYFLMSYQGCSNVSVCVWTDFSPPGSPLSMLFPPRDCFGEVDPLAMWDWSTAWVEEMEAQFRESTEMSQNTRAELLHKNASHRWSLSLLQFVSKLQS